MFSTTTDAFCAGEFLFGFGLPTASKPVVATFDSESTVSAPLRVGATEISPLLPLKTELSETMAAAELPLNFQRRFISDTGASSPINVR